MKKKKKHQQGIAVPGWLKMTLKNIERISPHTAMRIAAYIFSKPLKFKLPEKERETLSRCNKKLIRVTAINENIMMYEWQNNGAKVLLAHGWSGRGTQLYAIAESLHKIGYHVVSFDAPAHGKSTGNLTNMLQWVASIESLNKRFDGFDVLIGHSLGGMAILKYCEQHSNVKKIVTIGSGDLMRTIFDNYILSVGLQQKTSERMTSYFEKKYALKIDDYSPFVVVQKLQIPTLILHDEGDYDVRVDCADNLAKHHPNASIIKTKGLGHRKILRDENVMQQIKSFIQKS